MFFLCVSSEPASAPARSAPPCRCPEVHREGEDRSQQRPLQQDQEELNSCCNKAQNTPQLGLEFVSLGLSKV